MHMGTFWQMGIQIILFLQSLGAWLVEPMKLVTFLGNEEFYLFVAPAILWCLDMDLGLRIGLYLMVSGSLNTIIKMAFHGPRPYWIDTRLKVYTTEISFGVPSGHSQNAVVVWGTLANWLRSGWAWIAALALIFLIGFSRVYLGVHFPHDVLLGWVIGALLLWIMLACEAHLIAWFKRFKPAQQFLIVLGTSMLLILVGVLMRFTLRAWSMPEIWAKNASLTAPASGPPQPLALSGLISNAAVFFGLACGGVWIKDRGGFDARGPLWQRLLRFLIGLAGVAILWYGLGAIFPRGEALLPFILRYIRYALVGLWITALAPMLFIRLKLAQTTSTRNAN
jgi:membrane-associated phospholipid phosphatase